MIQRLASAGPHHSSHPFPVGWDKVLSLSSTLDSANNSGGQAILSMLGLLFQLAPIILSSAPPTPNEPPRSDPKDGKRPDKLGKGKARAVNLDDTNQPGPVPAPMEDELFADTVRGAMTASRSGSRVRSPDKAGPSGNFTSPLTLDIAPPSDSTLSSRTHPPGSDSEQAEVDHAILISSIENIDSLLHTLRANFVFPTRLNYHLPSDTDSTARARVQQMKVPMDILRHISRPRPRIRLY